MSSKIRTKKKLDSNSNLETKVLYIVDNSIESKIGDKMSHFTALVKQVKIAYSRV